jgi:predicted Zn-dependent protease
MRPRLPFLLWLIVASNSTLLAQGGHVISGVVRDEVSNKPLSTVSLQLVSTGVQSRPSITTGVDGDFSFTGLSDGQYSITATKVGYDPATMSVTVMRTGTQPVMILLHPSAAAKILSLDPVISTHDLNVPDRARLAYDKGQKLLQNQNKPADAIPEFQRAINAYPSYYEAYTGMGVASYQLGKLPEAEAALLKAIDLSSSKSLVPLYLLADIYNGQRRYADAELLARRAIVLNDSNWNGHFELARALVGLRRATDAEASALRAEELNPDNAPVHLVLANAHMLEQNYHAALIDFDAYLKLEPDAPLSNAVRQQRDRVQTQLQNSAAPPAASGPPSANPLQP